MVVRTSKISFKNVGVFKKNLLSKLPYFQELGVNYLHLMPIFESPEGESDGGYAVSNFRKVDPRFGSLADLQTVQASMQDQGMYLMIDIVLNHTSYRHQWAEKAKAGESDGGNGAWRISA